MRGPDLSGSRASSFSPATLTTSIIRTATLDTSTSQLQHPQQHSSSEPQSLLSDQIYAASKRDGFTSNRQAIDFGGGGAGSTGKGILIGILSAFGSAGVAVIILAIFFFFKYTQRGRVILDRIGRPGEYDDEQAFAREEADALEWMDELQRTEYLRAKGTFSQLRNLHTLLFFLGSELLTLIFDKLQPSSKPTLRKPCRQISLSLNSLLFKRKASPRGNLNRN